MAIEIKVPGLPESVADATVGAWHVQPGDAVERGDNILDLETDKVVLEVPAPENGVLKEIKKPEGETVVANDILAMFEPGVVEKAKAQMLEEKSTATTEKAVPAATSADLSPAVRRLVSEYHLDPNQIAGSGKGGRITKNDIEAHLKGGTKSQPAPSVTTTGDRPEKRVPMSRLRQRIAERLLQSSQNTAMLTTFNEIDMKAVMDLRKAYKEEFIKIHGVKLGFMSFFTKAVVEALKRFPDVNASIDGNDLVYHGYFDVGIAVSTERGLVVPVLRDADNSNMAEIEKQILDYATRAREGKLSLEEITGGTFTITNGGVFGSMLSTPIINPPQSAILGLHNIIERPMVVDGEIVIRPMMYLAVSYDHRIIDGKTSVMFLKAIKEVIEDPERLLLEV